MSIQKTGIRNPVIIMDFDGVIATNITNEPNGAIGEPIPGTIEALKSLKAEGWNIHIWTGRKATLELETWLEAHDVPFDSINSTAHNPETYSKKPFYDIYVDDRAVSFTGQGASTLYNNIQDLFEFNKRRDGEI